MLVFQEKILTRAEYLLMGDGIQKKYAVIINGDTEARHLENVERAVAALRAEGDYRISVLSTQSPKAAVERYAVADEAGLKKILDGIPSDDDDLLVVYTTGHGDTGQDGEGCLRFEKSCPSFSNLKTQLDHLPYGRRLMVMDNCFSGGSLRLFAEPKTTVVTQGSPGEKVSCESFSPYFWSDKAPDANGDGVVTLQERYAYALHEGKTQSHTQFFEAMGPVGLSGREANRQAFEAKTVEVHDGISLEKQWSRLQPGQWALVTFSADWCRPCQDYKKTFDALAKEYDGKFLMIRAEGLKGSEADWAKYGIRSFPTVAFVDAAGRVVPVSDRDHPMKDLIQGSVQLDEAQVQAHLKKLSSSKPEERFEALRSLGILGERTSEVVPTLMRILIEPDWGIQREAARALARLGEKAREQIPELKKLLKEEFTREGVAMALGEIAKTDAGLMRELIQQLKSVDGKERAGAAYCLGFSGKIQEADKAMALILALRGDTDPEVRMAAVGALRELRPKTPSPLPDLLRALQDKDNRVVRETTFSLGSFPEAADVLVPALRRQLQSSDEFIPQWAAVSLSKMGAKGLAAFPEILGKLRRASEAASPSSAKSNSWEPLFEGLEKYFPDLKRLAISPPTPDPTWGPWKEALSRLASKSPSALRELVRGMDDAKAGPKYRAVLREVFCQIDSRTLAKSAQIYPPVARALGEVLVAKDLSRESLFQSTIAVGLMGKSGAAYIPNLIKLMTEKDELGAWARDALLRVGRWNPAACFVLLESAALKPEDGALAGEVFRQAKGNPELGRKLEEYIRLGNGAQRNLAIQVLVDWGKEARPFFPLLLAGFKSSDFRVRSESIFAITRLSEKYPPLRSHLQGMAKDPDPRVAKSAQQALRFLAQPKDDKEESRWEMADE